MIPSLQSEKIQKNGDCLSETIDNYDQLNFSYWRSTEPLAAIWKKDSESIKFLQSYVKNSVHLAQLCESPHDSFYKLQAKEDNISFQVEESNLSYHKMSLNQSQILENLSDTKDNSLNLTDDRPSNSLKVESSKYVCFVYIGLFILLLNFFVLIG